MESAAIAKLFFHLADSSKLTLGGVAGLCRRHALLYETICEQGSVIFYFAVKFRCQSVAAEERLQPGEEGSSMALLLWRELQNPADDASDAFPIFGFLYQLLAARFGNRVELGAPVILRSSPIGGDPALLRQP